MPKVRLNKDARDALVFGIIGLVARIFTLFAVTAPIAYFSSDPFRELPMPSIDPLSHQLLWTQGRKVRRDQMDGGVRLAGPYVLVVACFFFQTHVVEFVK